jgi:DNA-binding transcriptional regulator Cro
VVDPSYDCDAQRNGCQPVANFFFLVYAHGMDKATLILKAGSVRNLATLLGITTQAVYKWRDVPADHLMRLRAIKPHWFRKGRK